MQVLSELTLLRPKPCLFLTQKPNLIESLVVKIKEVEDEIKETQTEIKATQAMLSSATDALISACVSLISSSTYFILTTNDSISSLISRSSGLCIEDNKKERKRRWIEGQEGSKGMTGNKYFSKSADA